MASYDVTGISTDMNLKIVTRIAQYQKAIKTAYTKVNSSTIDAAGIPQATFRNYENAIISNIENVSKFLDDFVKYLSDINMNRAYNWDETTTLKNATNKMKS